MTVVEERMYRFERAEQWAAGARRGLELRGDRLVVPDRLGLVPIPGRAEGDVLPAVDGCGVLWWLRPASRQLVRRPLPGTRGPVECGTLDGPGRARRLLCGRGVVWVLGDRRLDRYAAATLQGLTPVDPVEGWRASDAAEDGADGVWLVEVDTVGEWRLRHVDCWGRTCRPPIAVPDAHGDAPVLAATGDGAWIVVLDPAAPAVGYVVESATGEVRPVALDLAGPTLMTTARGTRIHLLGAAAAGRAVYQVLNLAGGVEDHQELDLPLGGPTALVGGPAGLVVACERGLADLTTRPGGAGERTSTFITPALVSPLGPRWGWSRAEIDVALPAGTAMDVTFAAADEEWLAVRTASLLAGPLPADLVDRLETLLPWRDDRAITYRGDAGSGEVERLAGLLDGVPETTLWVRVRLRTPPGRTPPELVALRVRYPDVSYLDHLPAVYRDDELAAAELRRILAPYEVVFDGLDERLALVAAAVDPATVGDDRTDYLLSWLGFPPLGDLAPGRRWALVDHAAKLLELRGTRLGLELLLELVTEGRATVTDSADEPAAWFLGAGAGASVGAAPARLGVDTISLGQRPPAARAGTMVVGWTPLGRGCPDPELVLAERAATVTVTVEVDRAQQRKLQPVIERLVPAFVPAHCRLNVRYTAADAADRSRRLDIDFQLDAAALHSAVHWRLGATTRLGAWTLPAPPRRPVVLDHGVPPRGRQRLH
ncbi:hypothetical protein [Modestobacter marinus]|uniref:hypothetical protein n=1 Tax=Modestobacter marinus TaxID=477641 RepID=UPI001C953ACA|nr:hypothetical protein [Modestobacter marinus]